MESGRRLIIPSFQCGISTATFAVRDEIRCLVFEVLPDVSGCDDARRDEMTDVMDWEYLVDEKTRRNVKSPRYSEK